MLTLIRGGGVNDYISGTDCPIDLKPSCIFKFVNCPEVYIKILTNLDLEGTLEWRGFYRQGSPKISLTGSTLRSMKVHDGSLVQIIVPGYQQSCY